MTSLSFDSNHYKNFRQLKDEIIEDSKQSYTHKNSNDQFN